MNKHTPGPWTMETVRTSAGVCFKVGPFPWKRGELNHACIYADYPSSADHAQCEANARLIAAAPDLLAALVAEPEWGERVCRVLGASVALNQHLGAHPADVDVLRGPIERRAVTGCGLRTAKTSN